MLSASIHRPAATNPKKPRGEIPMMPITTASQPNHTGSNRPARTIVAPVAIMSTAIPAENGTKLQLSRTFSACSAWSGDRSLVHGLGQRAVDSSRHHEPGRGGDRARESRVGQPPDRVEKAQGLAQVGGEEKQGHGTQRHQVETDQVFGLVVVLVLDLRAAAP